MNHSSLHKAAAALCTAGVLAVTAGIAGADTAYVDGDTATNGEQLVLAGEACVDGAGIHTSELAVELGIKRAGAPNVNANTFKNGTVVTVSEVSSSNAAISTELPSPATFTVPAGWESSGNGTRASLAGTSIAIDTTGVAVGSLVTGDLVHNAAGFRATDGNALSKDTGTLAVTGTVVDGDSAEVEDCVVPLVTITTPSDGQDFTVGDSAVFDFSCTDDEAGLGGAGDSGIATCEATDQDDNAVADNDPIDTSTAGSYSITVTATDDAGNTSSVTHSYTVTAAASVTYEASFKQPIDDDFINIAKLGRVIPVKAELLGDDEPQSEIELGEGPVSMQTIQLGCESGDPSDAVESYSAGSSNLGNQFRWDEAGGFWIYNLDTGKIVGAAANRCFEVRVYLGGTANTSNVVTGGTLVGSFQIKLTK